MITDKQVENANKLIMMEQYQEQLSKARKKLAEFVCAAREMQAYEYWNQWHGDGPDWVKRLADETTTLLGL